MAKMETFEQQALELATILDTMGGGLVVLDVSGVIARWNKAMESLTGYAAAEVLGKSCTLLKCHHLSESDRDKELFECDLFASGVAKDLETCIEGKDGSTFSVLVNARTMRDGSGDILGAVVTFTDLSAIKQLEGRVRELQREFKQRFEFHNIVGKSRQMQDVFGLLEMAAASLATVLIEGETGTGKELAAKAIHFHGARRSKAIVTVNCSALSEALLESELFGHVKGAFTGAISDKEGRFERADGGTIFLDEVGELPQSVQVKLLRVLQEREFERVGESEPRKVDVRVIAATNRNLRESVAEGTFREDLFYRLKVFPISMPPLRERKEDIEPLIELFISKFNKTTGKNIRGLTNESKLIIMDYCWPGNVRELENAIEHAFVICGGELIGTFDLPVEIRRVELRSRICAKGAVGHNTGPLTPPKPSPARRGRMTREKLVETLEECDWNKAEAARRLGATRTTIWRWIKKFNVE